MIDSNPSASATRRPTCRALARRLLAIAGLAAALAPAGSSATVYPGGTYEPPAATYGALKVSDVSIPMDDGVSLVGDVYYPTDLATGARAPGEFPVLLTQTPYTLSVGLLDLIAGGTNYYVERGYIFVAVDVRGTGRSGGSGTYMGPREARDGVQLVEWVANDLDGASPAAPSSD